MQLVNRRFLSLADLFAPERFGGSERVILELSKALARCGCETGILAGGRGWSWPNISDGIQEWRYPVSMSPLPMLAFTTERRFRSMGALPLIGDDDIALIHHPVAGWAARRAGALENRKTIAFFYGRVDEEWRWQWRGTARGSMRKLASPWLSFVLPKVLRRIQSSVLRRADSVVVLGHYTYEQAKGLLGEEGSAPLLIRPGVDLERFKPAQDKGALRHDLGIDQDCPVILSVRRLVPRMGLYLLLDALPLIRNVHRAIRLIIVGEGDLRDELLRYAARLGVAEHLSLPGFVSDEELPRYYQASDLFVLPSEALEGFGLVTLEALASGLPVVGTGIGETPFLLDATAGIGGVVAPGDAEALAEVCVGFLGSSEGLSSACRTYASNFTWDKMASAIVSLGNEL